ncbi:MAG TPA: MMPL family transporter [Jiangellaceae bacterium]|nr:MMPL family transporter [Jiangellaceae bacterium]
MLATLGSFVGRHARGVLVASVIVLVGVGVLGAGAFGKLQTGGFEDPHAESTTASDLIDERFAGESDLVFLVTSDAGTVDDPEPAAAGATLTATMAADPELSRVVSYWDSGAPALRSDDGSQALIVANLGDAEAGSVAERYAGESGPLEVTVGGGAVAGEDVTDQVLRDLAVAESIAVPLILILLVVAFGSLVAALLPLAVGAIAIMGTLGGLSVLADVTDVSVFAVNLTTALGLGMAIDYALLMVSRFREELSRGLAVSDAVVRTVETAGRTIVFSGLAVGAALAALLVFPLYFLRSFAYAGVGVVAIALLGAVVVLPALLTVLGPRVNAGRLPWAGSVTTGAAAPFWGRLAARVMRRPALAALPVMALLLVAATPLLQVTFGTPDDRVLPTSAPSRQVGDALRDGFAGDDTTAIDVVTTGPVDSTALRDYAARLSSVPAVDRVDSSAGSFVDGSLVGDGGSASVASADAGERLVVVTATDARSSTARALVGDVRDVPAPSGVDAVVGGETATLVDSLDAIGGRLPLAAGLVAGTTFVVLFLFTGSVIQPLRALLSNVLTLGATLGLMVLIFQEGFGSSLLGFTPLALDTAMLVLMFCLVFGLSMDYEMFVMSRIKEQYDAGSSIEEATRHGLARTGRIVTTAAALIAVSFFAFVTSQVSFIQMFGLGAGLAILIDATLVRGVVLPASMRLLGPASWYAPAGLRRLHTRIGLAEA